MVLKKVELNSLFNPNPHDPSPSTDRFRRVSPLICGLVKHIVSLKQKLAGSWWTTDAVKCVPENTDLSILRQTNTQILKEKVHEKVGFEFDAPNFKTAGSLMKEETKEVHEKMEFDTKSEASTDSLHGFQKVYVNLDFNVHKEREKLFESDSFNQKNNSKVPIESVHEEREKLGSEDSFESDSFNQKDNSKVLVESVATEKKPFCCDFCNNCFVSEQNKYEHMISAHEIIVSKETNCENCDASFKFQYELEGHMAKVHVEKHIEAHKCIICERIFKFKRSYLNCTLSFYLVMKHHSNSFLR